jgi:hypothetical protein
VSVPYLRDALARGDLEAFVRFVRLHLGDGNEAVGREQVDMGWAEAAKLLLDTPPTDREFVLETLKSKDPATLAHLFFSLHFYLVSRSGDWIHDGQL